MPRLSLLVSLLLLPCIACGGADTQESIAKETVVAMEDFVSVLTEIEDKASAEAKKPELDEIVARMKDLEARMTKIGEPSAEESAKLLEDSGANDVAPKLNQQMVRLLPDPEILAVLQPTLTELQKIGQ